MAKTTMQILKDLNDAFKSTFSISSSHAAALLPNPTLYYPHLKGKLFELHVLNDILKELKKRNFEFILRNGTGSLKLRPTPGPVNHHYSWIDVYKKKKKVGEIWMDTEFTTMSYQRTRGYLRQGDYHELDIAFFADDTMDGTRPTHNRVYLAAECKNTTMHKNILRSVLGLRRELSMLTKILQPTFCQWPFTDVTADPASVLILYCTDRRISNYTSPSDFFAIEFKYSSL